MKAISIGIAGLGTVAQGVLTLLAANRSLIEQRSGVSVDVVRVASRSVRPDVDLQGADFSTDVMDLLSDSRIDLIVELIGGETLAKQLIVGALSNGKAVVTANKSSISALACASLALSVQHGDERGRGGGDPRRPC